MTQTDAAECTTISPAFFNSDAIRSGIFDEMSARLSNVSAIDDDKFPLCFAHDLVVVKHEENNFTLVQKAGFDLYFGHRFSTTIFRDNFLFMSGARQQELMAVHGLIASMELAMHDFPDPVSYMMRTAPGQTFRCFHFKHFWAVIPAEHPGEPITWDSSIFDRCLGASIFLPDSSGWSQHHTLEQTRDMGHVWPYLNDAIDRYYTGSGSPAELAPFDIARMHADLDL